MVSNTGNPDVLAIVSTATGQYDEAWFPTSAGKISPRPGRSS